MTNFFKLLWNLFFWRCRTSDSRHATLLSTAVCNYFALFIQIVTSDQGTLRIWVLRNLSRYFENLFFLQIITSSRRTFVDEQHATFPVPLKTFTLLWTPLLVCFESYFFRPKSSFKCFIWGWKIQFSWWPAPAAIIFWRGECVIHYKSAEGNS